MSSGQFLNHFTFSLNKVSASPAFKKSLHSQNKHSELEADLLVTEEPIHLYLCNSEKEIFWLTLMCTPQNLTELIVGLLFNEGLIKSPQDIMTIKSCFSKTQEYGQESVVRILFNSPFDFSKVFIRHTLMNSSCGLCGGKKGNDDQVNLLAPKSLIPLEKLQDAIKVFKEQQVLFRRTGGAHALALFDDEHCIALFEDIGRHNAMDKLIGWMFLRLENLQLNNPYILTSSRSSYELIDKLVKANAMLSNKGKRRVNYFISIGAPTTKALSLSLKNGIRLGAFLRKDKVNFYYSNDENL